MTRNKADFRESAVKAVTLAELLAVLQSKPNDSRRVHDLIIIPKIGHGKDVYRRS